MDGGALPELLGADSFRLAKAVQGVTVFTPRQERLGNVHQHRGLAFRGAQPGQVQALVVADGPAGVAEQALGRHPVRDHVGRPERRPLVVPVGPETLGGLGGLIQ